MIRYILKKLYDTVFTLNFISFIFFLYLFTTRITPLDIDYFVKSTHEQKNIIVASVKEYKENFDQKKQESLSVKLEKKEINAASKNDTLSEADSSDSQDIVLKSDNFDLIYYSQTDKRWCDEVYGANNNIGIYGCGPTALSMILSTLSSDAMTPLEAARWAYDNGHFSNNSGSYHSIIPKGAEKHGLKSKSLEKPKKETIFNELKKGNLVVVLMNKGTFTSDGHFLILRGITENSEVLIADPKSLENSQISWDINLILKEAKYSASYGGPFWSISKS